MWKKIFSAVWVLTVIAGAAAQESVATESDAGAWTPKAVLKSGDVKSGSHTVYSGIIRRNYPSLTLQVPDLDLSAADGKLCFWAKVTTTGKNWNFSVRMYSKDGDGWYYWNNLPRPTRQGSMDWQYFEIPVAAMRKHKNVNLSKIDRIMFLGDKILRSKTEIRIDGLRWEVGGKMREFTAAPVPESVDTAPAPEAASGSDAENPATESAAGLWMPSGIAVTQEVKVGRNAVSSGAIRGNYPSMTLSFLATDMSAPDAKLKLWVKVDTPAQNWRLALRLYSENSSGWFSWVASARPTHKGALPWRYIEVPLAKLSRYKDADLSKINRIMILGDKIIGRPQPVSTFTIDGLSISAGGRELELKQNTAEDPVTETPPAGVFTPQAKIVPSEMNIGKNAVSSGVMIGNYPVFSLRIPEKDLTEPGLTLSFFAKVNTTDDRWGFSVRFSSLGADGFIGYDVRNSGNMPWRKFEIPLAAFKPYKTTDAVKTVKLMFVGGIFDRDKRKHRTEFFIDGLRLEKNGKLVRLIPPGGLSYYRKHPAPVKHPVLTYKAKDIERARENIRRHEWAQQLAAQIRQRAKFWQECPDEKLPFWIPDDGGYHVTCPGCKLNETLKPDKTYTKLTCVKCQEVFPSPKYPENSSYTVTTPTGKQRKVFFYKGENQFIHREPIGNRYHISLLLNFYRLQKLKDVLPLAFVHALDNDRDSAGKVRKILLRLAEVYPDYVPRFRATAYSYGENLMAGKFFSWKLHDSHIIANLALAYDLTVGSGVYSEADKVTIENRIFREYRELMLSTTPEMGDGTRNGAPAHFTATTYVALLLGEEDLLRVAIDGPTGVKRFIRSYFRRDGSSRENSPAYNNMAVRPLGNIVDVLKSSGRDVVGEIPEVRDLFRLVVRTVSPAGTTLPLGDSSQVTPYRMSDSELNYRLFPTPENRQLMNMCILSKKNYPTSESLFFRDPALEADPDMDLPWFVRKSLIIAGKECAVLRSETAENRLPDRALALCFNGQVAHGHQDALNIIYYRFHRELLTDLGYLGHPHRWTPFLRSLLAHNTVIVDGEPQPWKRRVRLTHYSGQEPVQCVSAESANLYPGAELCRRTVLMVNHDAENSYVVDTFLVKGGKQHDYLIHADGELVLPAGEFKSIAPAEIGKPELGTKYLYSAEKTQVKEDFTVKWNSTVKQDTITTAVKFFPGNHGELLKFSAPGLRDRTNPMGEVKIYPVILRKTGPVNHFVTLINGYRRNPDVTSAVKLDTAKADTIAMRVECGEFTDIILVDNSGNDLPVEVQYDGVPVKLQGKAGVVTLKNGKIHSLYATGAALLSYGDHRITGIAGIRGKVRAIDPAAKTLTAEVSGQLPVGQNGEYLIFPAHQDGYYRVEKITADGKFILHQDENIKVRPGDEFIMSTSIYQSFANSQKKEKFYEQR